MSNRIEPCNYITQPSLAYLRYANDFGLLCLQLCGLDEFIFIPNPGNAGDALIAVATYAMFKELELNYRIGDSAATYSNQTLVYSGGGNLLGSAYTEARYFINRNYRNNRIIILPHTVKDIPELEEWLSYGALLLYCREQHSYNLIAERYRERCVFLCADMAFSLADYSYAKFNSIIDNDAKIVILREDSERTMEVIAKDNLDISATWVGSLWHNQALAAAVVDSLAAYLGPYAKIRTNRLHLAILGGLMGKSVELLPNSYYKNWAIYQYSMARRWPHLSFYREPVAGESYS